MQVVKIGYLKFATSGEDRNSSNLRPAFAYSNQGKRSPSVYCCSVWNDIHTDIRNKPSVASFKSAIRHHFSPFAVIKKYF